MSAASDYLENALLDHVLGNSSFTQPANRYVALFTASPNDDNSGTGSELSGGSYARQSVTFGAAASGTTSNTNELTFSSLNGVSATAISHLGIYDASTGGNLLFHGSLTTPKTVADGEDAVIRVGQITLTLN